MSEQDYIRVSHLARITDAINIMRNVTDDPPLITKEELMSVHRTLSEIASRHHRWFEEQADECDELRTQLESSNDPRNNDYE